MDGCGLWAGAADTLVDRFLGGSGHGRRMACSSASWTVTTSPAGSVNGRPSATTTSHASGIEGGGHFLRGEQHLGVAARQRLQVQRVVPHDQQRPAGRDAGGEPGEQRLARTGGQMHELRGDEVERPGVRAPAQHILMAPGDAGGKVGAGRIRVGGAAPQRHRRHVDRRHLPAPPGEPDCVGALAAAHVKRVAGCEIGDPATRCGFGRPLQICVREA